MMHREATTVPVDGEGGRIPAAYADYASVFSSEQASELPPHRPTEHIIDGEAGSRLPVGRIYNLSEVELATLKAYIETNLQNGFIKRKHLPDGCTHHLREKEGWLHTIMRRLSRINRDNGNEPLPASANQ
jgi:hypothetical protein